MKKEFSNFEMRKGGSVFRIVDDNSIVKEYKIKNFQRYRDGGTTIIMVTDEKGVDHRFFSPEEDE